jgi:hypothetical protein
MVEMSNKEQDRVWEHSTRKGADLIMMLALANRANESGICWPGQDELAARVRVSKRTIQRITDRLVDSGEIVALDRPGKSFIYAILVGVPEDEKTRRIELAKTKQNVTGDKMSRVTNKASKGAKMSPPGAHNPAQTAKPGDHTYAQNRKRTIIEPSVEPSGNNAPATENIFTVYENCIGLVSPYMKELLEDWAKEYTDEWVMLSAKEAAKNNIRTPAYMEGILKRCKAEGRVPGHPRLKQSGNGFQRTPVPNYSKGRIVA